jgi:signal transduction histidine kinase
MDIWLKIGQPFVPTASKKSLIELRKSSILVFAHIFYLIAAILFNMIGYYKGETTLYVFGILSIGIIALLISFKYHGSTHLSANALCVCLFVSFTYAIFHTGGINSHFCPWIMVICMTNILVEDTKSATIWFGIVVIGFICLFTYGLYVPQFNIYEGWAVFKLLSWLGIGIYCFLLMYIFEKIQVFTIGLLKDKNILLKKQKQEIAHHVSELNLVGQKLQETNLELERFAFAASHDPKEPLRMIGMYTQLIQMEIKPIRESKTAVYMLYVTDGVKRMQQLLDHLLQYSRLGKNTDDLIDVNLDNILYQVLQNLTLRIKETSGAITYSTMPSIKASSSEMTQLFQNLIANALKFQRPEVKPEILITHVENSNEHLFSISDNGIGIDKNQHDNVFEIFKRLHTRTQYEGSGIGLATCKKIVNSLNGQIWLTSTEGVGTTFYFTIPKSNAPVLSKIPIVAKMEQPVEAVVL